MSAALVDANVLLDVMTEDAHWFAWSSQALENAAAKFPYSLTVPFGAGIAGSSPAMTIIH